MKNFYVLSYYINDNGEIDYKVTSCNSKVLAFRLADEINNRSAKPLEKGFITCEVVSTVYRPLEVKVNV